MAVYVITYDLNRIKSYPRLYEGLAKLKDAQRVQDSVWMASIGWNSRQLMDHLKKYIDDDDSLIVAKLEGEASWRRVDSDANKWMNAKLRFI